MAFYSLGPSRPPDRGPLRRRYPSNPAGPGRPPDLGIVRPIAAASAPAAAPAAAPAPSIYDQVMGIVNPQLQAAADMINRRSSMASSGIQSLTDYAAGQAGHYAGDVRDMFAPERTAGRATANYTRKALTDSGVLQNAGFQQAIGQAGVSGPGDVNLSQIGQGAAGAAYGTGIAALDALIAKQSASTARAALEPSFARMTGEQNQQLVAAQLARQLGDQQSQIQGQVPGLLLNLQQEATRASEAQRSYDESVREFNLGRADTAAQRKAGVTGQYAPTLAGRQAYWDARAAQMTSQTGTIYKGTTTGMRPVLDPKTNKPMQTTGENSRQIGMILATGYDQATGQLTPAAAAALKKYGVTAGGGVSESGASAWQKEQASYTKAMNDLTIKQQNANSTVEKTRIAQQRADETARHNRWVEQHPTKLPKGPGTAPSVKGGQWVSSKGKVLGAGAPAWRKKQINEYWNGLLKGGYIDGKGHLLKPIPPGWKPKAAAGAGIAGVVE